ncbi:MAG: pyrroloquinoline quinone biosynthesis protein PqqB [Alphaproteobacteria bacterium]
MKLRVLGSAAGGGFPQWNANSEACRRAWAGDPSAPPQTQSSVAVSADGDNWFLLNASPDLRQQINDNPPLQPRRGKRDSAIQGVVLTNGDVDHVAGLLNLRESQRLTLYATRRILDVLAANPIFGVLNPDFVAREAVELDRPFALTNADGGDSGLRVTAFAVPGKVALYLEDAGAGDNFGTREEDTIGLFVARADDGRGFFYVPGCAAMSPDLASRLRGAELVLFDGTLWRDDEMVAAGVGVKTGARMGHMSMSGPGGSIAAFEGLEVARRVFIHVNNSNPVLLADTEERAALEAAGWTLARDGMELDL